MKIKDRHYNVLKTAMYLFILNNNALCKEHREKHTAMRFRWDVLHYCKINNDRSCFYLSDVLYEYLNDDHIDTALKHIIKDLDAKNLI